MRGVTIRDRDERGLLDVYVRDILVIVGAAARESDWRLSAVECVGGPGADECHRMSDSNQRLAGVSFVRLMEAVDQVIDGEFAAYRKGDAAPWLIIRVVDSSALDVETNDGGILQTLEDRFKDVSEIPL